MKNKSTLVLLLIFGFALSVNASIICEPLGNNQWVCESQPYVPNTSYSWSGSGHIMAGGSAPVTYASCTGSSGSGSVNLTITYPNGSTASSGKYLRCYSGGGSF